jgi:hypothetical protein
LYEDLVSFSIWIYVESPAAAAVAVMFNLICYCSIAAVASIRYIDFLPSTLFGVSCRCDFRKGGSFQCEDEWLRLKLDRQEAFGSAFSGFRIFFERKVSKKIV